MNNQKQKVGNKKGNGSSIQPPMVQTPNHHQVHQPFNGFKNGEEKLNQSQNVFKKQGKAMVVND